MKKISIFGFFFCRLEIGFLKLELTYTKKVDLGRVDSQY